MCTNCRINKTPHLNAGNKGTNKGTNKIKLTAALVLIAALVPFFWVEKAGSSEFAVSASVPQIILTTNRMVILDDPGGWDGGNVTAKIKDKGNQWSGESTTIRWHVLLMNSSGRGAPGASVNAQLIFPNGTIAMTKTSITNSVGIAEFGQDMDRWSRFNGSRSEGIYTIAASAVLDGTRVSGSYNFIYDEWGCGSSGTGCHKSQFWQPNGRVDPQDVSKFKKGSVQNSPYLHAYDNFHSNVSGHGKIFIDENIIFGSGECLTCHRGFDGVMRNHSGRVTVTPQFPAGIHSGKTACTACHTSFGKGEMPIRQCYDCHPVRNNNLTVKKFIQTATNGFSFRPLNDSNVTAHNAGQNIPCIICHKGMHNVSKPLATPETSNAITEYQQCTFCHVSRNSHNNSVNCTVCHSQDAHAIKVLAQDATYITGATSPNRGNCTSCHTNASFLNILLSQPKAGSFSGRAPQIPGGMNHSNDPIAGQKWNSYWNPGNKLSACYFCHGDTKHSAAALGRPSQFKGGNTVNSTISSGSSWCQQCHYQGGSSYPNMVVTFLNDGRKVPPENTGNATYGNFMNSTNGNQTYFNHSGFESYADAKCKGCHGGFVTGDAAKEFVHNVAIGRKGGPDCIGCHDYGRTGSPKRINSTAMSLGMHAQLNRNSLNSTDVPAENKKCWGCHQSDGSQPPGGSMGDRQRNPYKCYDCHSETKPYANVSIAPNVSEHFAGGTDIKAAKNAPDNSSSCVVCHNLTEMKVDYTEDDTYSTRFSLPSHYGRKRANDPQVRQGERTNCTYCHQNTSTAFTVAMVNISNSNISNHSTRYSSSPYCTDCHNSGWIHNSTLTKPALQLPGSTFCLGCHGLNASSGSTNRSGMITGVREKHNNSVNCTACHLGTGRDIHPVKYLQPDGGYTRNISSAVNCTSCHQNPQFFESAGLIPPQIPRTLNHSNDPIAGQKWNAYWNPGNRLSACYFCHGDTKHSAAALGRPSRFKGGNTVNSSISSGSTWCQQCHYQGGSNYSNMVITFLKDGRNVPPENTGNSTYGNFVNSTDGNQTYFNHSGFESYADARCRICHGGLVTGNATKEFVHNVATGRMGGPDCASCHDTGGIAPKTINFSIFKQSVHRNLNRDAANTTPLTDMVDKACWACHDSNGTQPPNGSMGDRQRNPRKCYNDECHVLSQSFKAPMLYSHFKDADLNGNPSNARSFNISTKVSCVTCHSNSLNAQSKNLNASVSHYGSRKNLIDSMNCIYCHLDEDNAIRWGNAVEINKNRTTMVELDRERNKFTARKGESVDLGQGFRLRVVDVKRESAAFELYKVDKLLDSGLLTVGEYQYEENLIIKNSSSRTPVLNLNVTGIFTGDKDSFIQFEGSRTRRLHRENRTTSCYKCHFKSETEKRKYSVIDRKDDYLYYTQVLLNSSDRKEYDQDEGLRIIANATPSDAYVSMNEEKRKTLKENEKWELGQGFILTLKEVSAKSDSAQFSLEAGGRDYTDIVKKGEEIEFEIKTNYLGYQALNISIFRARVSDIQSGKPGIAVLEDILALSPDIKKIKENTTIFGYNTSWLWKNNSFMTGRIPSNFHSPQLYDGRDGGPDCTTCHTKDLGIHKGLNKAASGSVSGAKPCWGCHGNGKEPRWHPATYRTPRKCKSCHVERKEPFFNATYVGDEKHGTQEDCTPCHVTNTHTIRKSNVTPGIMDITISKKEVDQGETVVINARAGAGHMMRLKAADYFIDSPDKAYPLYPIDGSFDNQMEEFKFQVNTTGMKAGEHLIYVRAMERNNKWGEPVPISLVIREKDEGGLQIFGMRLSAIAWVFISLFVTLTLYVSKRKSAE